MDYREWVLNDISTTPFFHAIRDIGDVVEVPEHSKDEFERQRQLAEQGDQRALLLEPFLTFNGGSYRTSGHTTGGGRRTARSYQTNLRNAHTVITETNPRITALDWLDCLESEQLGPDDFVFVDPPYIDCTVGPYKPENVLHTELIEVLKSAPFTWILSEYRQPLYLAAFREPFYTRNVQLRTTNFARTPQERRVECLWTNIGGTKTHSVTVPERYSETLLDGRNESFYISLPTDQLLAEIAQGIKNITASRNQTSAELRRRLLPALIELKKRLKGKKPGFYEVLRGMGLNPSTVRVWFHRGRTADEVINLLEEESDRPSPKLRKDSNDDLDATQHLLRHADKMAAAILKGKIDWARRLANEYANARMIDVQSEDYLEARKALREQAKGSFAGAVAAT